MEIDGWNLDVESLPGPTRADMLYVNDVGFSSPDDRRIAVIYSIDEIRMGWDVGLLAVFQDRKDPRLLLNPDRFLCCCPTDAVVWLTPDLFAVKKYYYSRKLNKINVPFALIDLSCDQYSFIAMPNSYSYTLSLHNASVRIVQHTKDDLFGGYDGQEVSFSGIPWFTLGSLDSFDSNYADSAA